MRNLFQILFVGNINFLFIRKICKNSFSTKKNLKILLAWISNKQHIISQINNIMKRRCFFHCNKNKSIKFFSNFDNHKQFCLQISYNSNIHCLRFFSVLSKNYILIEILFMFINTAVLRCIILKEFKVVY